MSAFTSEHRVAVMCGVCRAEDSVSDSWRGWRYGLKRVDGHRTGAAGTLVRCLRCGARTVILVLLDERTALRELRS